MSERIIEFDEKVEIVCGYSVLHAVKAELNYVVFFMRL